jgi:hypothetical protein
MVHYYGYASIYIVMFVGVMLYGKWRSRTDGVTDPLSHEILPKVDGWVLSHFTGYLLLGYFFPKTFRLSMFIGILWECFETWAGETKPDFLKGIGDTRMGTTHSEELEKKLESVDGTGQYWWYGQYEDVIANGLGFLVGMHLSVGLKPAKLYRSVVALFLKNKLM